VDLDESAKMLPNYITISTSDDRVDFGPVDNTKRDAPDLDGDVDDAGTDAPSGATVLSANGPTQGFGMGWQQYAGGFPPGVSATTVSTAQGFRQWIVNGGSTTYTALLMYYLADYNGDWYRDGNIDGGSFGSGGSSRVIAYADLAPGQHFCYEPTQSGSYTSYSSIVFRRCDFANRYIYGYFT